MGRARSKRGVNVDAIMKERLASTSSGIGDVDVWSALAGALHRPQKDIGQKDIGVWDLVDERTDPARFRPKLADDIEVKHFPLRWGNHYAMVANPRAMLFFRLEPWEANLLELMDGSRTVAEIIVERLGEEGDLDAGAATGLVMALQSGGFLDPHPPDVEETLKDHLDPATPARRKLRTFLKTLSIDWSGANRLVNWWYRNALRWLFTPLGAVLAGLLAAGGLLSFIEVQHEGRFTLGGGSAPAESLILLGLSFVLTFAHELGHAVVLTHYGRRVKSAGFMIYFGSPAFFVEASDGLMLDRGKRIVQSFAGPFAELVLAGAASLYLRAFPESPVSGVLFKFALLNYFVIFLNLIPLLELDGYWILSDLIQVPDLRPRSLAFIQRDLWHKLRTRESLTPQELGLGLYGLIGIVFTVVSLGTAYIFWKEIFGGLISSLWNGGIVSRLLLILLALFLAGPALRGAISLGRVIGRRLKAIWRRIRFRTESRWRVEAAELIDALPVFDDLPVDVLNDFAGRVSLRIVRPLQSVFRQGDRPLSFYVVRTGRVGIEEEDPDTGDTQLLRVLTRGDSFGELGLLQSAPRSATARAIDEVELFEIQKGTFDRLLADSIHAPAFGPTMATLAELRELPAFAGLGSAGLAQLLEHGKWITAAPATEMIAQGAEGDAFYAIRSGQVDIVRDGDVIASLGSGAHFGEIALLSSSPRNATVVARTPLRAFRLDRAGFEGVIADAFRRGSLKTASGRTWQH
jgi:putative peptide zinc metalloprotease protein